MIDIIIPAYNAKKLLKRALYSIALQKDITNFFVYIINDAGEETYEKEINYFQKFFYIKELKMKKNGGPGVARQYGIEHSNSKYIIFMDSDDYFYDPYALFVLYNSIEQEKTNISISNFIYERDEYLDIRKNDITWLHGKIYEREFIEKNKLHFNSSRTNEDVTFNKLYTLCNPKIGYIDRLTYVYSYDNSESITRKDNGLFKYSCLEEFANNFVWIIKEAQNRNINEYSIADTVTGILVAMYYYYMEFYKQYDSNEILKWSYKLKKYYDKYKLYINEELINTHVNNKEEEYKNIEFNRVITFPEFLNKIEGEQQ